MRIYLDNAATTMIYPEVADLMHSLERESYANASSVHKSGARSAMQVEKARMNIAASINADPDEIYFTSGGTEANNTVLKGVFFSNLGKPCHIISSTIEHPSIRDVLKWLETIGCEVTYIPVDREGFVDPADIREAIKDETALVSIMHANNEIGTIEPIEEIGSICKDRNVLFHTDACQSFTKTHIDLKKQNIDLMTLNAHKIHGPKGVGALYMKKGTGITPLVHGGGQETGFRSGTYNTAGIAGFGKAVELANPEDISKMEELRDYFIWNINEKFDILLNGPEKDKRLSNNVNVIFKGHRGKDVFLELNKRGIDISTGSACSNTRTSPSKVLIASGLPPETANGAVRFSLSVFTTKEELDSVLGALSDFI